VGQSGLTRLRQILDGLQAAGVDEQNVALDVSIARGLDYYTGAVFETFLDDLPAIGSVCSGGRYDNLAGLYSKQELPGIGASLGLDRLLAAMEELGMIERVRTPAEVLVTFFDKSRLNDYLRLAGLVRRAGFGVEVFPEPKKLGQQLKYADQRGFRAAVIAGSREFEDNACQVKNLQTGDAQTCSLENEARDVIDVVRQIVTA
jgi:histidyl-tRNA synthetase